MKLPYLVSTRRSKNGNGHRASDQKKPVRRDLQRTVHFLTTTIGPAHKITVRPCRSDTARLEYSHQTKCRPASEMSHTLSTLTLHCSPLYILIRINRIFILVTIQPKIEPLKVSSIGGQPMRWLPNVVMLIREDI